MTLIIRCLIAAAAVWVAVEIVPGISIDEGFGPLLAVSLILGLVNALVRPILTFLACGLVFLTLGLFLFVINAGMLLLSAWIAQGLGIGFHVDGFWPALLGSLVITIISFLGSTLLLSEGEKAR
jgi:putative membrane protein